MNNRQDEIKDIVAQLQRLQIQETELLRRLERLSETDIQTVEVDASEIEREFRMGDLVQILNPKPFDIKRGMIIKIGATR
jgi:hypothetical protein